MIGAEAPAFWWGEAGWQARLLAPAAWAYGRVAGARMARGASVWAPVPVLCVGNLVAGGGGKTPTAIALGRAARRLGFHPGFVSRGHGGRLAGPVRVDPARHSVGDVGDEPLLLARHAPTAVARDRPAAARLLVAEACDFLVMDDGFQSMRLGFDLALLAVDAVRGVGNGRVLPAGPLRAPLERQLAHADALLLIGEGPGAAALRDWQLPVHRASLAPRDGGRFAFRRLLAFAGIADPEKFYRTLRALGADLVETRDFPDHHPFAPAELDALARDAKAGGLALVTTAKDFVRLPAAGTVPTILDAVEVLEVDLAFTALGTAEAIVGETAARFERRTETATSPAPRA